MPVTASTRGSTMAAPKVPADRQPVRPNGGRTGSVVMQTGGERPGWANHVQYADADEYMTAKVSRREAQTLAEAANAQRIAAAQQADRRMHDETDKLALAIAKIPAATVAEHWLPFRLLYEACQANESAPAWAASVWVTAMVSPDATISPLDWEYQRLQAPILGPVGLGRTDWRTSWHLVEELTAGRHNQMPDPRLAARASWRSPECSWVAVSDEALLVALMELLPAPDTSAAVRGNRLVGDSPVTKLASMLLGPGR